MHGVSKRLVTASNGTRNEAHHQELVGPTLLLFSASHAQSLKMMQENYEAYLRKFPNRVTELAYTLAHHREYLSNRSYSVCDGQGQIFGSISQPIKVQSNPLPTFVFTGQGAQYAQMGAELMDSDPQFLQDIQEMDTILAGLPHAPGWKLESMSDPTLHYHRRVSPIANISEDEISAPSKMSRLSEAEFAQPACTALQIALVKLLLRWGIRPAAVVGHSSGEIAAAYAAGALSVHEAITIAYYRGYAAADSKRRGGMAAIGLGREQVEERYCSNSVVVACENSASSVTISGDEDALDLVLQSIKADWPEKLARKLRVEKAYHSRQ